MMRKPIHPCKKQGSGGEFVFVERVKSEPCVRIESALLFSAELEQSGF